MQNITKTGYSSQTIKYFVQFLKWKYARHQLHRYTVYFIHSVVFIDSQSQYIVEKHLLCLVLIGFYRF